MQFALAGMKVLDLTMNVPGPYMTWLLAELGAEVLKVENPVGGDYARALPSPDGKTSPIFEQMNRKKGSLSLNLKSPEGREIFFRLLDEYDVLVEGFRPGVMASFGLDYDRLKAEKPRLIYVSITGYGQDGPYSNRGGHDLNYLSLAGVIQMNGVRSGELAIPGIQIADLAGGSLMALSGLLAAAYQRERTNQGQFVDVSMCDGSFALTALAFSTINAGMEKPGPASMILNGAFPFYNLYQTKDDRTMSLGAVESKFWKNFCLAVNREDLLDKQFGGSEVIAEVAAVFAGKTLAEWEALFENVDACCEPVRSLDEAADSALAAQRGLVDQTGDGRRYMALPLRLSGSERPADAPAPTLGRDTADVLHRLGYQDPDIEDLRARGVV